MAWASLTLLAQTLLTGVFSYCIFYVYNRAALSSRILRLGKQNGCKPARKWRNKDPIFGLDFLWDSYKALKRHRALENTQRRYMSIGANTVQVKFLGQVFISTIEPENLKTVMSLKFKDYELPDERKKLLIPMLGEGIFTTDGAAWQHSREMLRPNFVRSQIGDIEMFERHVGNLIQAIPQDGSLVDLQDLFFSSTLDIATEFLFGTSTNTLRHGETNAAAMEFVKSFSACQNSVEALDSEWGFLGLFLPDPKLKTHIKIMQGRLQHHCPCKAYQEPQVWLITSFLVRFVDTLIGKAQADHASYELEKKQSLVTRYIFLHELLSQTNNVIKIRSELLNILLAGRDTTASMLSNVWWELSRQPEIWARLQQEVRSLNGELPTFEALKCMKYLQAVNSETLRMYPVVPENSRQAVCGTILPMGGGDDENSPVYVAKGQVVHWSTYTMQRRKDIYGDDAEDFRPERWLDGGQNEVKSLRVGWQFLPFNGGPRICIGQQFALTEVSYITVRLMQEFGKIESRDAEPWREKVTLTCTGLGGCKVVLKR